MFLRSAKDHAKSAISAHTAQMQATPFRLLPPPHSPASSPCWTPGILQVTPFQQADGGEILVTYNTAMDEIASKRKSGTRREPLMSQMDSWEKSDVSQRDCYIRKASEDCTLVCDMTAPNDGKQLFQAMASANPEKLDDPAKADDVMIALMNAYKNATNRSTQTQILSLYAYKYSVSTVKKLHMPYGKLSTRQIHRARCHARTLGPGSVPEQKKYHRVRIDMSKVDHFIEFVNRPYFYKAVSYGSRSLKLDSGETIEITNVVRTVTRSTMISQYI